MGCGLVSVVFSFRNEEENLPALIERVTAALSSGREDYELVFVNDASTDRSLELLMEARKTNPRVKVITMSRRFGPSEGVLAGMESASGDAVIYMDSDLQDPPELIPELLRRWRQGAEVVHTVRESRRGETWFKKWMTRRAYEAIRRVATVELPVEAGDFKLLSRRAAKHLLDLREHDPYIRGLAAWIGFVQDRVPYERDARRRGSSKFPLFSRNPAKTFVAAVTSFSFAPIYAVLVAALVGLLAAGGLLVAGAVSGLAGYAGAGTVLVISLLTFFWASALAAVGIVGLYVLRIYKDVRGRPRYIVQDKIGFDTDGSR